MALDATVNASRGVFPLSDAMRHVAHVSLVHSEPTQEDLAKRAANEGAALESNLPDMNATVLPVVAKENSASNESAADMLVTTGSG